MSTSLARYILENNPQGALKILDAYGVVTYSNSTIEQSEKKLNWILSQYRDEAIYDFARQHPDFDLIAAYIHESGMGSSSRSSTSNACGCSGMNGVSNCDGCGGKCGGSNFGGDDENIQQFRILGFDGQNAVMKKVSGMPNPESFTTLLNPKQEKKATDPAPYLFLGSLAALLIFAYKS